MAADRPPPDIPDHRLLRRVGQGSYGEVWLARNVVGTGRAVKVVYRDAFPDGRPYEREFAGVQKYEPVSRTHKGLMNLLQIGRNDAAGYFYYVMELADAAVPAPEANDGKQNTGSNAPPPAPGLLNADGYVPRTLRSALSPSGRLPLDACLEIGIALADAAAHLHRHGLVHRDIKPSNVIFVEGRPKLADIGLVTEFGEAQTFVGTTGFVPPEGPGSAQADVFSLGKLLYEISTGKDRGEYPAPLTELTELPDRNRFQELNEVILKACEPDPARRYASMAALRRDLVLVQAGESVRHVHVLERRFRRFRKLTAAFLALLLVGATAYRLIHQERESRLKAELEARNTRLAASDEEARLNRELVRLTTQMAAAQVETLFSADRSAEAIGHLAQMIAQFPSNRVATERLLSALTHRTFALPITPALSHTAEVYVARFSPDGERVGTASRDGTARVWDAHTGKPITPPLVHAGRVRWLDFSPDGRLVATASEDGTGRLWDARTGQPASPSLSHKAEVWFIQFSPDGHSVVTASSDQTARLWAVPDGQAHGKPLRHEGKVDTAQFSLDGRRVVTASEDGTARVWDAQTGEPLSPPLQRLLPGADREIAWAEFSPNGVSVVTASSDHTARLWNWRTGETLGETMQHSDRVRTAAFSPDGRRVLTASWDHTARLWDAQTGRPLSAPMRHADRLRSARFSPDGFRVVTTSTDHTVRVWDAFDGQPLTEPFAHQHRARWAEFSSDGLRVVTASEDGTARVWDIRPGQEQVRRLPSANAVDFSQDGRKLALGRGFGGLSVYSLPDLRETIKLAAVPAAIVQIHFHPDGKSVFAICADNAVRVFEAGTGALLTGPLHHARPVSWAEFSPDGCWLVTASFDKTAQVWDARTYRPHGGPLRHENEVWSARFSPDGQRIVTASLDGTACIWNVETGQPLTPALRHQAQVHYAEFSPDGTRVVTASNDTTARLWRADTGEAVGEPLRHGQSVRWARFSPDGDRLLTVTEGGSAWIWDLNTGSTLTDPLRHENAINSAEFSPNGRRVATASTDQTVRLWDVMTGQPVSDPLIHPDTVALARFSPDGQWLITATYFSQCRMYALPEWPNPAPTWLAPLAQALTGEYATADAPPPAEILLELRDRLEASTAHDPFTRWGQWFFADRIARPATPFAKNRLDAKAHLLTLFTAADFGNLRELLRIDPTNRIALANLSGMARPSDGAEFDYWQAVARYQLKQLTNTIH